MRDVGPGTAAAAALLAALVGCSSPRTLDASSAGPECARCHGFPPSAETGVPGHPLVASDATVCATCHAETVGPGGELLAGGAHQDGEATVTVAHPVPYPNHHLPDQALADIASCTACHGSDYGGGWGKSCNDCHARTDAGYPGIPGWTQNCTFCHGTRTAGVTTATAEAAPPGAVLRGDPGASQRIGAHPSHLGSDGAAPALPCDSCHAVPTPAQALTHFTGNGARGAIAFSAQATKGAPDAAYVDGRCNVYCHGAGTEFPDPAEPALPAWATGSVTCGSCHAMPPASGPIIANGQPAHLFHVSQTLNGQPVGCPTCHPAPPARHVNGTKDVVVQPASGDPVAIAGWTCSACHGALGLPFVHGMPFEAQHTTFALADLAACARCHGADLGGLGSAPSCNACHAARVAESAPDWKANCTFCHGTRTANATAPAAIAAPPQTVVVTADQTPANPRIGAHQRHVGNGSTLSSGVACAECHPPVVDLGHVGGSGAAQIAFGPLATSGGAQAVRNGQTCSSYCHGAAFRGAAARPAPTWAPPAALTCGSCHEASPTTGQHPSQNSDHRSFACGACHGAGFSATTVDRAVHVDGAIAKDPDLGWNAQERSCSPGCHDTERW